MHWRTEPGEVKNSLDEVWVGVKGQSNLEIAGSPRNSFRASLMISDLGVEHCQDAGGYHRTNS